MIHSYNIPISKYFKNEVDSNIRTNEYLFEQAAKYEFGLDELLEHIPTKTVDIKDIVPTQVGLHSERLDAIDGDITDLPLLCERDGLYYVEDGHHRIARMIIRGEPIRAKVYPYILLFGRKSNGGYVGVAKSIKDFIDNQKLIDDEPLRNWDWSGGKYNLNIGDSFNVDDVYGQLPESAATPDKGVYTLKVIPITKTDHYINGIINREAFAEDDYDMYQTDNLNKIKKTFDTKYREPIIVSEGKDGIYSVIDGHHRLTIADELGRKSILALVREYKNNKYIPSHWETTIDYLSDKYNVGKSNPNAHNNIKKFVQHIDRILYENKYSNGGEMKFGEVMTGKGWSYSNVIKFKVGNRADKFDKLVVGNYYVHPIHKRYTDSYEYQVMKFIGFEERKRSMYAATYSKSEKPVLTAIFKSDDSVNTSDYSVPKYQFKDFEIYECEIMTDKNKLGGSVDSELIQSLDKANAVEKIFSDEKLSNIVYKAVLENENFIQRNKKYAAQNKIMEQKQIDFVNGQGMEAIRNKLIQKNTEASNAVADLITIELANIRAKQFDYKTEEGKAKSKEQYDIKNEFIEKLYKQYIRNNWIVRYEPSTIPNIKHTLFFTLPESDIQMSYHGNFENIPDIEQLPKGKWDGIAGATFHKLEEKSADILGEQIEDTHWRRGVDLGFTFVQRYLNELTESDKEALKTTKSIAETYERFSNIPEDKRYPDQNQFIQAVNDILQVKAHVAEKYSISEVEDLLGRKLHWWNDSVVKIKGNDYKKVYLQPYYQLVN